MTHLQQKQDYAIALQTAHVARALADRPIQATCIVLLEARAQQLAGDKAQRRLVGHRAVLRRKPLVQILRSSQTLSASARVKRDQIKRSTHRNQLVVSLREHHKPLSDKLLPRDAAQLAEVGQLPPAMPVAWDSQGS